MDREHTILMISEWNDLSEELSVILGESGYCVRTVTSIGDAIGLIGDGHFDLVILGSPGNYLEESLGQARIARERLEAAGMPAPPLAVLTYEPTSSRGRQRLTDVTVVSVYDFEIDRFLDSVQAAIRSAERTASGEEPTSANAQPAAPEELADGKGPLVVTPSVESEA